MPPFSELRTLIAAVARPSRLNFGKSRTEAAAALLAHPLTDAALDAAPLSDAPLASDLLTCLDFFNASVFGSVLRSYEPRRLSYHRLLALGLVQCWSVPELLPPPPLQGAGSTPRRASLNVALVAEPSVSGVVSRLVVAVAMAPSEPLAIQTVDEFHSAALRLLARPPLAGDERWSPCRPWLAHTTERLAERVRIAFSDSVSHNILLASSPPKHARR